MRKMDIITQKTLRIILIVVLASTVLYGISKCSTCQSKHAQKVMLNDEFKGKIVKKYYERCTKIQIQEKDSLFEISVLTKELIQGTSVGDSIIKIKGNNCIIKNNFKTDTLPCYWLNYPIEEGK